MSTSGDGGDKKKSALHEEGKEEERKMAPNPNGNGGVSNVIQNSPTMKRGRLQTKAGTTATSVAALRRSGLRFTDVDDPNALRVQIPEPGDILFGRGRGFQEHPGNQRMLKIISKYKQAYKSQKRSRKREFVEAVYDEITKGGSRFLKKLEGENCWAEVSIPISLEKVSHTLRGKRKCEDSLSATSGEEDTSDQLIELQKRRRASTPSAAPTGGTPGMGGMTSDWLTAQTGFGASLLPNAMTPSAAMANSSAGAASMQNPSQAILAQAQLGAASQLWPTNAASVMSSMPQGLSAYGAGLQSAALSAYAGNPFMLGAASSLYGVPQTASNSLLGAAGAAGVNGAPAAASSLYGAASSLAARDPNLAITDLARLELLRKQQQLMNASAPGVTTNPLLASQIPPAAAASALASTTTNLPVGLSMTRPPLTSQLVGDAAAGRPLNNSSANKEKAGSNKDSEVEL